MRDYSKVSAKFWIGKTGKALRKQGVEAVVVGMYLMTAPNSNMLGLYYLPMVNIAHETGLGLEGAYKGLQGCIEAQYCAYDEESEMVWVHEMASYQIADSLDAKDNRCKGIQNEYNSLPDNPFLPLFHAKYAAVFHMTQRRGAEASNTSPSIAPCKPLSSQEQEQEKEQEQKQEQKQKQDNPLVGQTQPDPVPEIFAYWQKVMASPKSALDAKRKTLITNALKNYSPADICKAIRGCSKSPHNMGKNDRNTKYNGLNLILRDAEHIDYFINLDSANAKPAAETIDEMNARIAAEFLGDGADENTIEMEV